TPPRGHPRFQHWILSFELHFEVENSDFGSALAAPWGASQFFARHPEPVRLGARSVPLRSVSAATVLQETFQDASCLRHRCGLRQAALRLPKTEMRPTPGRVASCG